MVLCSASQVLYEHYKTNQLCIDHECYEQYYPGQQILIQDKHHGTDDSNECKEQHHIRELF